MNWDHGGDIHGYRARHGREPLDFSASLNPFGMPPGVRAAACRAVDAAAPYPDPFCRELAAATAARLGVAREQIFFGNGAADVIFRLAQGFRPRRALVTAPAFVEYEQALVAAGCAVSFHPLDPASNFDVDDAILDAIAPGLDMLFLCQPNNPTGRIIDRALLERILARCETAGAILVLDECFVPLTDGGDRLTLMPEAAAGRGVILLGSFTKLYAMAGLRLGYAVCGRPAWTDALDRAGPPWPVSTVAQAAGLAALDEARYVADSLAALAAAKQDLCQGLTDHGLHVIGAAANYVFFHSPRTDLAATLARSGIMIRDCAAFRGLAPGYYRVAVLRPEHNQRLLKALP